MFITKSELEPIKSEMLKLMPESVLQREMSFAMQIINTNANVQKCSKESLQRAVYNIALTGLSLNPVLKYAYIIPRWSRDGTTAVLEPSYQGLIKLLTDTGSITAIYAHLVYANDEFSLNYGTNVEIHHKPQMKDRGEIIAVYAVAVLTDGYKQIETMTIEDINAIRDKSESYKAFVAKKVTSCIWEDHYGEMAKKTVIKRIFKYLPKTDKFNKVANAIAIADEDYGATDAQIEYLITMIEGASYDDDSKQIMINKVYEGISKNEFDKLLNEAKMNTMDAITAGRNYNQGDIIKHINKLAE